MRKTQKAHRFLFAALFALALPLAAQDVVVTSADPSYAEQGTVNLNVNIYGKGFKQGARSAFYVTGTTNPGGIIVNSTAYVSPTQLTANINVADTADLAKFDIEVRLSSGRTGKGIEKFAVIAKGANACILDPVDTSSFVLAATLNDAVPTYTGHLGTSIAVKSVTLGGVPVLVAAVGSGAIWGKVEVFFLDPSTGAVLDGQTLGANTRPQPHLTMVINPNQAVSSKRIDMGDVNGDGVPDIVVASGNTSMAYAFFSSVTNGILGYTPGVPIVPSDPGSSYAAYGYSVAVGDLDPTTPGAEVVVGSAGGGSGKKVVPPKVFLFRWIGSGLAQYSAIANSAGGFGTSVAIGDIAGDANPDLIVGAWTAGLYVYPGPPSASNYFTLGSGAHVGYQATVANVDGNLDPDLLGSTDWAAASIEAEVFSGPVSASQPAVISLTPVAGLDGGWATGMIGRGDINNDGLADVLIGAPNAPASTLCPAGSNSVGAAYLFLTNPTSSAQPLRYVLRPPSLDSDFAGYGWSVAIADGTRIFLVADHARNIGSVIDAGQVYVYRVNP